MQSRDQKLITKKNELHADLILIQTESCSIIHYGSNE